MPYVKKTPRYDSEGNIVRYDYYLAENIRDGVTVKTNIIRRITEEKALQMKEQDGTSGGVPSGNGLDTQILKKLIPTFAKAGITVILEEDEKERIRELAKEVLA